MRQGNSIVMIWVSLAHRWKGAGCEMDGGRSGQVSIDVTDTFNDLIIIWSSWNQFICHRSSQFEQVNKKVQLLIAPKPSWTCSKEKKLFCDVGGLLASAFPWLQPLQLFSVGVGQTPSLKGQAMSNYDFKTAVEDINVAILDKYICTTAAIAKQQCKAFLLTDCGNFEHFLTSL